MFCCNHTCYCVGMFPVTSASRYVPLASRYRRRSSMFILGLIPRNSPELAEAVPIAISHADVCSGTSGLNWVLVLSMSIRILLVCKKQSFSRISISYELLLLVNTKIMSIRLNYLFYTSVTLNVVYCFSDYFLVSF